MTAMDLGLEKEEAGKVVDNAGPLFRKAEANLIRLVEAVKDLRGGEKP